MAFMGRGARSASLLVAVTVLSSALPSLGFHASGCWGLVPRGGAASRSAIGASVRPGSCVPGLRAARMLDEAAVAKNMEAVEAGTAGKASTKVFKAVKKSSGAFVPLQEFARSKAPAENIRSMLYQNWSFNQRRDKRAAIIVDTTVPEAMDDLELFVKEQQKAKGSFPGAIPVLRSGPMTVKAVAEAKAVGADGVVVSFADDGAADVVAACAALSMEAVGLVADEAQLDAAVQAGCTIIGVKAGMDDKLYSAGVALKAKIPATCAVLAYIDSRISGTPQEVFDAQEVTEVDGKLVIPELPIVLQQINAAKVAKFQGVIIYRALTDIDSGEEVGFGNWLCAAALTKASAKFANLSKDYVPGGGGRPPVKPEGILTRLEGSTGR